MESRALVLNLVLGHSKVFGPETGWKREHAWKLWSPIYKVQFHAEV